MAKPFMDVASSGFHVHVSLLDALGHNVFADPVTGEGQVQTLHQRPDRHDERRRCSCRPGTAISASAGLLRADHVVG